MSATFWNMRRRKLREQLGIVREIEEKKPTEQVGEEKPKAPSKKKAGEK